MSRNALQAAEGKHEQRSARGVLPGGWVAVDCVSVVTIYFEPLKLIVERHCRILQKHIKRQIISLSGGFQVIADLNAYNAFVTSLKVRLFCCSFLDGPFSMGCPKVPAITSEFANLKMLGHVYIVEDAKDLAQIVRDVTRYGGAYRPEVRQNVSKPQIF